MKMNVLFLTCAAVISVKGQFLDSEYRLDSVPLPIRRRTSDTRYEIQPSIGREVELSKENARVSNQERRHIDNNRTGNIPNGDIRNIDNFGSEPFGNIYQTDDRNYENMPNGRRRASNRRTEQLNENQHRTHIQGQDREISNRESDVENFNRNSENRDQNQRYYGNGRLKTNLDNQRREITSQQGIRNQEHFPTNHNLRTNENPINKQINTNQDSRHIILQSETNTNIGNLEISRDNQGNQPNYTSDDITRNQKYLTNQQTNENFGNMANINNGRRNEASQRAIDSNSYGNQQNNEFTNQRNNDSKPRRQNSDTKKDNRNRENYYQTTEPIKRITSFDIVTGGMKSTEDNELISRNNLEGRSENEEDDRWIWIGSSNITDSENRKKTTTPEPTLPTVDDRAAFALDDCPTGKVRYNNKCIDKDN